MWALFNKHIGLTRVLAFSLLAFALFVRAQDPIPLQVIRNLVFDSFQQIKPRDYSPAPVVIVDVDDRSIAEIGQWPWPRTRFAEIVDRVTADGPVVLGFDIVFSEPDRLSPEQIAADNRNLPEDLRQGLSQLLSNDQALATSFSRSRVVLGQTSVRLGLEIEEYAGQAPEVPHAILGNDPRPYIQNYPDLIENLPELEGIAAGRGMFNVRPEYDGVYRRVPIVMVVEDQLRLGLSPEMLRVASSPDPRQGFSVRTDDAGVNRVVLARVPVPTSRDGTVRPYLTHSMPERYVSATDILNERVPPGRFAGHLVLFGTSAIGLEDYRATALGYPMAGVEIHAQLMENMLSQPMTFLQRPSLAHVHEMAVTLLICTLIIALTPIMRAGFLIVSTLVFLLTLGFGSYLLFARHLLIYDATLPIMCGLATVMFMSAANYLREERSRRQIRTAFGQYVSKDLVSVLSENHEKLQLGGESREITLLFSDVQGFTAIAESYRDDPAGLTTLMNTFLTRLSNAILEERGTIDKFMGDAVMAFWNAPLSREAHEVEACRAALEMIRQVDDLNKTRQLEAVEAGQDMPVIEVGIGLNTGLCTVGNMGSDLRFDYTAMGDPVNLASRLEGQTRYYGTRILVGSATVAVVQEEFALLEMDLIRVKGKAEPERIFALMGGAEMRRNAAFVRAVALNDAFLSAYRQQDWGGAEKAMSELEPILTYLDPRMVQRFDFFRERIVALKMVAPPEGWDGVYDATSK